jgi:hypothetical protein
MRRPSPVELLSNSHNTVNGARVLLRVKWAAEALQITRLEDLRPADQARSSENYVQRSFPLSAGHLDWRGLVIRMRNKEKPRS